MEPYIIVTQLVATVAALAAFGVSLHNAKQIKTVEHATNSLMDRLVAITAKASFAEGVKSEEDRRNKM